MIHQKVKRNPQNEIVREYICRVKVMSLPQAEGLDLVPSWDSFLNENSLEFFI